MKHRDITHVVRSIDEATQEKGASQRKEISVIWLDTEVLSLQMAWCVAPMSENEAAILTYSKKRAGELEALIEDVRILMRKNNEEPPAQVTVIGSDYQIPKHMKMLLVEVSKGVPEGYLDKLREDFAEATICLFTDNTEIGKLSPEITYFGSLQMFGGCSDEESEYYLDHDFWEKPSHLAIA